MPKTSSSNSYPFGSSLPTRSWSDVGRVYRFGFNTQEKDNEISGDGNSYTADCWEYDSRSGRRWNLDPIDQIYLSNYCVLRNCPLILTDIHGDKFGVGKEHVESYKNKVSDRKSFLDKSLKKLEVKLSKAKRERRKSNLEEEISGLKKNIAELGNILCEIEELENSNNIYDLALGGDGMNGGNGKTNYNPSNGHITISFGDESALAHELVHAFQGLKGNLSFNTEEDRYNVGMLYDIFDEVEAYNRSIFYSIMFEEDNDQSFINKFRKETGTDNITVQSLLLWNKSESGKGNLNLLPMIQLNTNSKVSLLNASNATKLYYGNLTYDEWQKKLIKKNITDTSPSSIEQYNEISPYNR